MLQKHATSRRLLPRFRHTKDTIKRLNNLSHTLRMWHWSFSFGTEPQPAFLASVQYLIQHTQSHWLFKRFCAKATLSSKISRKPTWVHSPGSRQSITMLTYHVPTSRYFCMLACSTHPGSENTSCQSLQVHDVECTMTCNDDDGMLRLYTDCLVRVRDTKLKPFTVGGACQRPLEPRPGSETKTTHRHETNSNL